MVDPNAKDDFDRLFEHCRRATGHTMDARRAYASQDFKEAVRLFGLAEKELNGAKVIADDKKRLRMREAAQ